MIHDSDFLSFVFFSIANFLRYFYILYEIFDLRADQIANLADGCFDAEIRTEITNTAERVGTDKDLEITMPKACRKDRLRRSLGFLNIFVIFMAIVMKGNHLVIVFVNSGC